MSWWSFDSGVVKSIEGIAKELIETKKESAEAQAVMLKTIDPNGMMRRGISSKFTTMYMVYMGLMMLLVLCQSFGVGNSTQMANAIANIKELFLPLTTSVGAIVSASFGVNAMNTHKNK
jgi:hypothetical protein